MFQIVIPCEMYPVTHATIASGAVRAGEGLIRKLTRLPAAAIDYRFVVLGAELPDAIDKPLVYVLFPGHFHDSHAYGHTLLLPAILILAGLLLARRGDLRLLVLGLGCLTHPLVDPVDVYPRTLFWPLFGTSFAQTSAQDRRFFLEVPLEVVLVAVYAIALWRSEGWRAQALAFMRSGAFPFKRDAV